MQEAHDSQSNEPQKEAMVPFQPASEATEYLVEKIADTVFNEVSTTEEVSTTKEQKMVTFNVSFVGVTTIHQKVSATVSLDEDDIRRRLIESIDSSNWRGSIDYDGSEASITVAIDLEDEIEDAVRSGDYADAEVIDDDIYGEAEWDDIDEVEVEGIN
jgi:hypothetical protein